MMDQALQLRWEAIVDRFHADGFAALSPEERSWLSIRTLIDSIENGGLISYFYNSGANNLEGMLEVLTVLEEHKVASLVSRVAALFSAVEVSDFEMRNAVIESWNEDANEEQINRLLEEVDDQLMPLMAILEEKLSAFLYDSYLSN